MKWLTPACELCSTCARSDTDLRAMAGCSRVTTLALDSKGKPSIRYNHNAMLSSKTAADVAAVGDLRSLRAPRLNLDPQDGPWGDFAASGTSIILTL